jgi:ribonuclease J
VRLAPGAPEIIGAAPTGLLYRDGDVVISESDGAVRERAKLSYVGVVSVALAVNRNGEMVGDPDVVFAGVPKRGKFGEDMAELIDETLFSTFEGMPRGRRRDANTLSTAIERAVRGAVYGVWGKKPLVHVMVVAV